VCGTLASNEAKVSSNDGNVTFISPLLTVGKQKKLGKAPSILAETKKAIKKANCAEEKTRNMLFSANKCLTE